MQNILEHVNLTVNDSNATAAILSDIFNWQVRWQGPAKDNGYTVHLGTQDSYLALYSHNDKQPCANSYKSIGQLNHIGVVVDDLETIEAKVKANGLVPFNHGDYEPGKRFYFKLDDQIEIEVVSYQ